jgi:hypothetical protein
MKMGSSLMVYDHEKASGDISVPHSSQLDVAHTVRVGDGRLTMEEHGDAVFTKTAVRVSRDQVSAVASTDFADVPSPATAVTDARALLAEDVLVSHFSLSTLSGWGRGKIVTE